MKKLTFLFLFFTIVASAQKINNQWIVGGTAMPSYTNQQVLIDFNGDVPAVSLHTTSISFSSPGISASLCNDDGELLFFSNGFLVLDKNGDLMENGSGLSPILTSWQPPSYGHNYLKAYFVLPDFESKDIFHLFYGEAVAGTGYLTLEKLVIDMSQNNGLGLVTEKNVPIYSSDSLYGYLSAIPIKHANGRDWWLLTNKYSTNTYHRFLFTPNGVIDSFPTYTVEGPEESQGVITSHFILTYRSSTDGSKILVGQRYDGIWIYDFDRCTGLLSNGQEVLDFNGIHHHLYDMILSKNNRYLYVGTDHGSSASTAINSTIRLDLWSENPSEAVDTITKWQYFVNPDSDPMGEFSLFPNGIIGINGNKHYFHGLPYPDSSELILDTNYISWDYAPYLANANHMRMPNYYLGPIDGSSCDTLGLDNNPLAHWRYDRQPNPLSIKFVDLTYYEPTYWAWDFGDGETSMEQHPAHIFAEAGIYDVCLIAGNENASDTLCKTIMVGMLSADIVADTLVGCVPLTVQYHAETVAADGVHWDFEGGEPSASNSVDVEVTYDTVGLYMVHLTAMDAVNEMIDSQVVIVHGNPVADYQFNLENLEMMLSNTSFDATSYIWDFGDGTIDTTANPVHLFTSSGSYTIQLIAFNDCGSDTIHQDFVITSTEDPASSYVFSLYPNPNTGVFGIVLSGGQSAPVEMTVYDANGREIWKKEWPICQSLNEEIDLNEGGRIPQGTYFYVLQFGDSVLNGQVFVE